MIDDDYKRFVLREGGVHAGAGEKGPPLLPPQPEVRIVTIIFYDELP